MPGKSRAQIAAERLFGSEGKAHNATYSKATDRIAADLAIIGYQDQEIAEHIGVTSETFTAWKLSKPSLRAALANSREKAHSRIVRALHRSARGYTLKDERLKLDAKGQVIETTQQKRHFAPNVNAAALVLTNRDPGRWKDRKAVEHSGTVNLAAMLDSLEKPSNQPALEAPTIDGEARSEEE